ncbi:hypothetical protein [Myceligenerans crystallogenes]|uniref:DUF4367 domain-containing protein n=1 Tax=Myceligenerans crystallogenes TaxID=316335 RepID=A0ABN2NBK2_9MICO
MNRETHEILNGLAPTGSPDPTGLETARAAFERGRSGAHATHSVDIASPALVRSRSWGVRHAVAFGVVGLLLIGTGAAAAVIGADRSGDDLPAQPGTATPWDDHDDSARGDEQRDSDGSPEPECGQYFSPSFVTPVPRDEWDELLEHPVTRPDVPITAPPSFGVVELDCPDGPYDDRFVDREGRRAITVDRGITLYYGQPGSEETGDDSRPVEVRDTNGRLASSAAGFHVVEWTEDGENWRARFDGTTADEALAQLDELQLGSDGVSPHSVPEAYERVTFPEIEPGTKQYHWYLWQGTVRDGRLASGWPYVEVVWPAVAPLESRAFGDLGLVDFDGTTAVYRPAAASAAASFTWIDDGVMYGISDSDADLATMKQIARDLEPVDIDDPRLRLDEWNYD